MAWCECRLILVATKAKKHENLLLLALSWAESTAHKNWESPVFPVYHLDDYFWQQGWKVPGD